MYELLDIRGGWYTGAKHSCSAAQGKLVLRVMSMDMLNKESTAKEAVAYVSVEGDNQEELEPKNQAVSVVWKCFGLKSLDVCQTMVICCYIYKFHIYIRTVMPRDSFISATALKTVSLLQSLLYFFCMEVMATFTN